MRAMLFCGVLTLLGGARPSTQPAVDAKPQAKAGERPAPTLMPKEPWLLPLLGRPESATQAPKPSTSPLCTGLVMRADPLVDADMAKPMENKVDSGMVAESPCRK